MYIKQRLYCPGPTQVPEASVLASLEGLRYHRSDSFEEMFLQCVQMLAPLFGCSELPLILSSSGTGAMEAAMSHVTSPGDAVLVMNGGKFGERWSNMARALKLKLWVFDVSWGEAPNIEKVMDFAKQMPSPPKAIFFQATETSTAVDYDVQALSTAMRYRYPETFVVVDAITALGARSMRMDDWGVDVMVSGSQKGFGVPPGLSFIALSKRSWEYRSAHPKFYFDLHKERQGQIRGVSAWTPAVTLVAALKSSLVMMHSQGLENIFQRHKHTSMHIQEALKTMGLKLFANQNVASVSLSSFYVPENFAAKEILDQLSQVYGAIFAPGQGHLKGKIMRLSHLGFYDAMDMISAVAVLEMSLRDLGYSCTSALPALVEGLRSNKAANHNSQAS